MQPINRQHPAIPPDFMSVKAPDTDKNLQGVKMTNIIKDTFQILDTLENAIFSEKQMSLGFATVPIPKVEMLLGNLESFRKGLPSISSHNEKSPTASLQLKKEFLIQTDNSEYQFSPQVIKELKIAAAEYLHEICSGWEKCEAKYDDFSAYSVRHKCQESAAEQKLVEKICYAAQIMPSLHCIWDRKERKEYLHLEGSEDKINSILNVLRNEDPLRL